jgi:hypothetical protein
VRSTADGSNTMAVPLTAKAALTRVRERECSPDPGDWRNGDRARARLLVRHPPRRRSAPSGARGRPT